MKTAFLDGNPGAAPGEVACPQAYHPTWWQVGGHPILVHNLKACVLQSFEEIFSCLDYY